MSITLRSRLRTTLIWLVPSSLRSSSYHGDTYHYLSPSTLRPSPTNIHTRRTSQFQSVATHGMHIHLNVRTFNSDSWQGPERANRTGIPPPSSPLIDLTPLPPPLPSIVLLLSGFPAKSMLYLVLVLSLSLSHLCCLIPFRISSSIPQQVYRSEVTPSRSRSSFLVPVPDSPLSPISPTCLSPNDLSPALVFSHLISTVMFFPSLN